MIIFRVDSSTQIGSGHLMRCLTLAHRLEAKAKIAFVARNLAGNLNTLIKENGFEVLQLPQVIAKAQLTGYEQWLTVTQEDDAEATKDVLQNYDIELLVIDSYAIDELWENKLRPFVGKIMVIDDLANRKHNCDILLDQNYYAEIETRYTGLVPPACKMLLGPKYALLRQEFYAAKQKMRKRDGSIKNILVFFGGSDLTNETMKALQAITMLQRVDITINVVVGNSNPHRKAVAAFCKQYVYMHYYCQVSNMAELMNEADLAIGAGGSTIWERCFLGLPALVIAVAGNQVDGSLDCSRLNFFEYLGVCKEVETDDLVLKIRQLISAKQLVMKFVTNTKMVDVGENEKKLDLLLFENLA